MSTRRPWTAAEVRRAQERREAGMSLREIAASFGRSEGSVQRALSRGGFWPPTDRDRDYLPRYTPEEHAAARNSLAFEVAEARAERNTAPLLKKWPEGTWK